ncbi:pirin family protein [Capnocytophaga cynodegmi]|uniref:Putative Quercetin 2,3-dioxygenase n=1 Tax=Capnocytophaga cynodegmi TaxID=28189 RepID=A0A0B7HQU5_9FLAO|nr:pirin family protein [Capnocytophaga cynodegmi]CEN36124.1 putative Quercetin 2,3-dioxygenase [Capnocytophaga cynodegmi]CEN40227.1 putative Quercetin 2,3-dioxygenase [Capnocytophaga cynodegmi]
MNTKHIEKIVRSGTPHFVGDGFRVHNFIPGTSSMERMDPFIMMDYNAPYVFPPSEIPKGVDVHPHKGFETVTIAYKGKVEHADSAGGGGVIGEGDVQWMTAGNGILHKEFHETEWSKSGGLFHMMQLWVNLPAKYKTTPPKYQAIKNADIPKVPITDGEVAVIAGEYNGVKGAASTFSPIHMYNVRLQRGGKTTLSFPKHYTTTLVTVEGSIRVNEQEEVAADHFVLFKNDGENFTLEATSDALILVLSGEPIAEPIAAYGPFVMNTRQELIQAFQDFEQGKFGELK